MVLFSEKSRQVITAWSNFINNTRIGKKHAYGICTVVLNVSNR